MNRGSRDARAILHVGFTVLPIAAGADKFLHLLTDWDKYLAPWFERLLPVSGHAFMSAVGAVEIAAGLLVALRPRFGAWLVAGWLALVILNLATLTGYGDVALRDVGLCLAAIAFARLSAEEGSPA